MSESNKTTDCKNNKNGRNSKNLNNIDNHSNGTNLTNELKILETDDEEVNQVLLIELENKTNLDTLTSAPNDCKIKTDDCDSNKESFKNENIKLNKEKEDFLIDKHKVVSDATKNSEHTNIDENLIKLKNEEILKNCTEATDGSDNFNIRNSSKITGPTSKSILTTNAISSRKQSLKKSVSFDPDDDLIKKFIEGEVIVDKKNPFKNGFILENGINGSFDKLTAKNTNNHNNKKSSVFKLRRDSKDNKEKKNKNSSLSNLATSPNESEFITTEEVLRQSKYVKTYIKNPDKYFIYDPSILQRLKYEELKEIKDREQPKLKKSSSARLKESKAKINVQSIKHFKAAKTKQQQTFKKVSKPNYPELSDIKVKIGTDLEESLFSPEEVTRNAKKFDERLKTLHVSSDDDLDEIDEPLTKSDSSDDLKAKIIKSQTEEKRPPVLINVNGIKKDQQQYTKTFSNTVKSREFQEYLNKKGLTLTPQRQIRVVENGFNSKKLVEHESIPEKEFTKNTKFLNDNNMEQQKKNKKQSVLQRIKSSALFSSSKRKTSPKEPLPTPALYPVKENGHNNKISSLFNNKKRVTLVERQSFHGSSTGFNNLSTINDQLKRSNERSRKSYCATTSDYPSSSISSALTNVSGDLPEDDSIKNSAIVANSKQCSSPPRSSSRNSDPGGSHKNLIFNKQHSQQHHSRTRSSSKENLHNSTRTSQQVQNNPENVKKTSLHRQPAFKASKNLDYGENEFIIPLKRSIERQSTPQKRITTPENGNIPTPSVRRSTSADRYEISKRNVPTPRSNSLPKLSRNNGVSNRNSNALRSSKERPKLTLNLTTISANKPDIKKPIRTQKPISTPTQTDLSKTPLQSVEAQTWRKLKEIKEKTDKELFNKAAAQTIEGTDNKLENIYEKVVINPNLSPQLPHHQQIAQAQEQKLFQNNLLGSHQVKQNYNHVKLADNFVRGLPQRNTFNGIPLYNRNSATTPTVCDKYAIPAKISGDVDVISAQNYYPKNDIKATQIGNGILLNNSQQPTSQIPNELDSPVRLRRKEISPKGSTLTRQEILQKVKEYCRQSMNKTPTKLQTYNGNVNNMSPPNSYTSEESTTISRQPQYSNILYQRKIPTPQVPQRIHSLPSQSQPRQYNSTSFQTTPSTSPIYAHVTKRSSFQSIASDAFVDGNVLPFGNEYYNTNRKNIEARIINEKRQAFLQQQQYAKPRITKTISNEYVSNQPIKMNEYGNIPLSRPIALTPTQLYQFNSPKMTGRSTPLILERMVNNQGSQIYWTPVKSNLRYLNQSPILQQHEQHGRQYLPTNSGILATNLTQKSSQQSPKMKSIEYVQPQQPAGSFVLLKRVNSGGVTSSRYQPIDTNVYQMHPTNLQYKKTPPRTLLYESESGSEAGEIRRIMQQPGTIIEQDWQNEKGGRNQSNDQVSEDRRRAARREDPRRHTLGHTSDMLQYGSQTLPGVGNNCGGVIMQQSVQQQQRAMDLEVKNLIYVKTPSVFV